jgi:hypothetical protein
VITAPLESTAPVKQRVEKNPPATPEKSKPRETAPSAAPESQPELFQGLRPSLLDDFLSAPVKEEAPSAAPLVPEPVFAEPPFEPLISEPIQSAPPVESEPANLEEFLSRAEPHAEPARSVPAPPKTIAPPPPEVPPDDMTEESEALPKKLAAPSWTPPASEEAEPEPDPLPAVGMGQVMESHSSSPALHTTRHTAPLLGIGLIHLEDLPGRRNRHLWWWVSAVGLSLIIIVDLFAWVYWDDIRTWMHSPSKPEPEAIVTPGPLPKPAAPIPTPVPSPARQEVLETKKEPVPAPSVPEKKEEASAKKETEPTKSAPAAPEVPAPKPVPSPTPKPPTEPASIALTNKPKDTPAPALASMPEPAPSPANPPPTSSPGKLTGADKKSATVPITNLIESQPLPVPAHSSSTLVSAKDAVSVPSLALIPSLPLTMPGDSNPVATATPTPAPKPTPAPAPVSKPTPPSPAPAVAKAESENLLPLTEPPPPPSPSQVAKLDVSSLPVPPPPPPLTSDKPEAAVPALPGPEKMPEEKAPLSPPAPPVPETKPEATTTPKIAETRISDVARPALDALKKFLLAANWQERLKYCRKQDSVRAAMERHYRTHSDGPISVRQIELIDHYPGSSGAPPYCTFWVRTTEPSQSIMALVEEPSKGNPLVDWEAFVEFKDRLLWEFLEKPGSPPQKFRVTMQRKHYFDKDVPSLDDKESFLLLQPGSNGEGHVFATHDSAPARQLAQQLGWGSSLAAIVELTWRKQDSHRWVEILKVNNYGWRN